MPASEYVWLRGGLAVPQAPVLLLFQLEDRGIRLRRDGNDIIANPASLLTVDECAELRRWKRFVLALLDYEPPPVA